MTTDTDLLLALWHEVGHGADLAATVKAISARLATALPHARLELIRCDAAARRFETAADTASLPGRHWQVTPTAFKALSGEMKRSPVLHLTEESARPEALAALSAPVGKALLVGLLHDGGPLLGLAVLTPRPGGFEAGHRRQFATLLEPLTAVLARDVRLHELDQQRAIAEEERQLLLTRLGRDAVADTIVGADRGLHTVMQRVAQVARSDSSVLLLGETGSGKEVVARAIHERSRRAGGPFVRVNCGALAPELVDSELFGHEKGSFTGAIGQRRGWFERADGGTLFLDEVGELPLSAQVRLLRVLQDGGLQRVGGEQTLQVEVRIVAATHRDLPAMVAQGAFREDLWYRLAVFPIRIPPLRERRDDIPELAHHFARRACLKLGLPPRLPDARELARLADYPWPGNVRELATVIERAALLGSGDRLDCAAALGMAAPALPSTAAAVGSSAGEFPTLDEAMAAHIRAALARTQGRVEGRRGAARLLAINPHTLRARMRKLGVVPAQHRPADD